MTFIASVVARNGVAIIADSLVTSSLPILHHSRYVQYLDTRTPNEYGKILISPEAISELFEWQAVYTKDFEEKLFKLNKFTAVMAAGAALINDKKIITLINEFITIRAADIEDLTIPIETRLEQFGTYLASQVREHLAKYPDIFQSSFIIPFYDKRTSVTRIFKLYIAEAKADSLNDPNYKYLLCEEEVDWVKVVCDGQNKLSKTILNGVGGKLYLNFSKIVEMILIKLALPESYVPVDFISQLLVDPYFSEIFYNDFESLNLSELSLQQAVDLASLLMRLEIDFQKYTRNIPTVGGVIKLAVIDENGFRYISGTTIHPPKYIHS